MIEIIRQQSVGFYRLHKLFQRIGAVFFVPRNLFDDCSAQIPDVIPILNKGKLPLGDAGDFVPAATSTNSGDIGRKPLANLQCLVYILSIYRES